MNQYIFAGLPECRRINRMSMCGLFEGLRKHFLRCNQNNVQSQERRVSMSMFKEFKAFAMRGNVVDMAIGIIIGAAFGKIVASIVNDVLMPPIGLLLGGVDFSGFAFTLKETSGAAPAVVIRYGVFINTTIDFIIVAFAIFLLIRAMNRLQRKEEAQPTTTECPECRMTIPVGAKRCGHCAVVLQPA